MPIKPPLSELGIPWLNLGSDQDQLTKNIELCKHLPFVYPDDIFDFFFSDDPVVSGIVEEEHAGVEVGGGLDHAVGGRNFPDPEQFCSCGLCTSMPTPAESFCCKSMNYLQAGGRNDFTLVNRHSKV